MQAKPSWDPKPPTMEGAAPTAAESGASQELGDSFPFLLVELSLREAPAKTWIIPDPF